MTKSQYKVLLEELDKVLISVSEKEIKQILPQIRVFLSESNVFGNYEEIDEPDQRHPVDILKGQLLSLTDNKELSKWYAILAVYLAREMEKRNRENDLNLANFALYAVHVSKTYFSEAELQFKQVKKGIKEQKSKSGTKASKKRHEALNDLKDAAFSLYEFAAHELKRRQEIEQKTTKENRITYLNIAKIVYPQVAHLNEIDSRPQLIGRNGRPIESLARIFEEETPTRDLSSTRELRKHV